ncbi:MULTISPECIES: hypothetical protein [unclassified Roseofilum]|uniref:hypothetical protein n=1 Tax=unclassified Roseofilum TaxID=2620099 RepID=UPI001B25D6D6|nr:MULTISPECIES: hypothetical protein [unclassified Roseofilum]MBP0009513.1 hypothetical protein [Roseofilum sp. Belize Diploria]MBP0022712.1 hypothetical protein [Roseofilum sp. SID2]MBP0033997.1 hypothetical protein [Roseofilum sp. Belize BBD 4]MBP0041587.1 hypothetical protein [Roseofilum sp. SBFL]
MENAQTLTITVTPEKTLELPPEVQARLNPGEQYLVSISEEAITLTKAKSIQSPAFDWQKWEANLETQADDSEKLSIEEICEIVREVRQNRKA